MTAFLIVCNGEANHDVAFLREKGFRTWIVGIFLSHLCSLLPRFDW